MSPDLELAIKIVVAVLTVLAAGTGLGKWLFGRGGEEATLKLQLANGLQELKTLIGTQFGLLSARQDRVEQRADKEAAERAAAIALEQERRMREAVENAREAERARSIEAAVSEIVEKHEKFVDSNCEEHEDFGNRLLNVEGTTRRTVDDVSKLAGHVKGQDKTLQEHHTRLAILERRSGPRPAVRDDSDGE